MTLILICVLLPRYQSTEHFPLGTQSLKKHVMSALVMCRQNVAPVVVFFNFQYETVRRWEDYHKGSKITRTLDIQFSLWSPSYVGNCLFVTLCQYLFSTVRHHWLSCCQARVEDKSSPWGSVCVLTGLPEVINTSCAEAGGRRFGSKCSSCAANCLRPAERCLF